MEKNQSFIENIKWKGRLGSFYHNGLGSGLLADARVDVKYELL